MVVSKTRRCGRQCVPLNKALVLKLKEGKVIRGRKLRFDTTVGSLTFTIPTDTGLLNDDIRVITRVVGKLKKAVLGKRGARHRRIPSLGARCFGETPTTALSPLTLCSQKIRPILLCSNPPSGDTGVCFARG